MRAPPTLCRLQEFEESRQGLKERGLIFIFPKLLDLENEDRLEWIESKVAGIEYLASCTSKDAVAVMASTEALKAVLQKSPLILRGDRIFVEPWTQTSKTKLQYRAAYNSVIVLDHRQDREQ